MNSIRNLSEEEEISRLKVLGRGEHGGWVYTAVLFSPGIQEFHPASAGSVKCEVEGTVLYFAALVIRFALDAVRKGRRRAIVVWRRIFSDRLRPQDGIPVTGWCGRLNRIAAGFFIALPGAGNGFVLRFLFLVAKLARRDRQVLAVYGTSV